MLQREVGRPLVVVAPDAKRAQELRDGLRFFTPGGQLSRAVLLQAPDISPYHPITPNRFIMMERLATLYRLSQGLDVDVTVIPAEAMALKTLPRSQMVAATDFVLVDETLDRDGFSRRLDAAGYVRTPVVEDLGTYAVRGGIIDVWPALYPNPVRIDLFGDMVESMRFFDAESQRSGDRLMELHVPPSRGVLLTDEAIRRARSELRHQAAELGIPAPQVRAIIAELDEGMWPLGVDGWLPAFFDELSTVTDYVPANALWCVEDPQQVRGVITDQLEQADL